MSFLCILFPKWILIYYFYLQNLSQVNFIMGVPVEKLRRDLNCIWIEFKLLDCTLQQNGYQFLWSKHPFYQYVIQANILDQNEVVHITYLYTTIIWKPVLLYTWHIYMGVVLISCTLKNLFPNQFLNVQKIIWTAWWWCCWALWITCWPEEGSL